MKYLMNIESILKKYKMTLLKLILQSKLNKTKMCLRKMSTIKMMAFN